MQKGLSFTFLLWNSPKSTIFIFVPDSIRFGINATTRLFTEQECACGNFYIIHVLIFSHISFPSRAQQLSVHRRKPKDWAAASSALEPRVDRRHWAPVSGLLLPDIGGGPGPPQGPGAGRPLWRDGPVDTNRRSGPRLEGGSDHTTSIS